MKPLRILIGVTAALALLVPASGAHATTRPPPKPRMYIFGDSLLDEARAYIDISGLAGFVKGRIGAEPCDVLHTISTDAWARELKQTKLLILETAANSDDKCMLEPGSTTAYMPIGSPEWEAKYRADLDGLFDLSNTFPNLHIVLLAPPPMDPSQPAAAVRTDLIDTVFPQVASDVAASYPNVTFSSVPRDAMGGGTYTSTAPCLPDETEAMGCVDGTITVRAPDGLHFCPTGLYHQAEPCALPYNPGGRRFGDAIETVLRANV